MMKVMKLKKTLIKDIPMKAIFNLKNIYNAILQYFVKKQIPWRRVLDIAQIFQK